MYGNAQTGLGLGAIGRLSQANQLGGDMPMAAQEPPLGSAIDSVDKALARLQDVISGIDQRTRSVRLMEPPSNATNSSDKIATTARSPLEGAIHERAARIHCAADELSQILRELRT